MNYFMKRKKLISWLLIMVMVITLLPMNDLVAKAEGTAITADVFTAQEGGETIWRVTGVYDWDEKNPNTVMSHLVGEYYAISMVLDAGTYAFKFTKDEGWKGAIGSDGISDNAANFSMTLTETTKVNFYLNDELEGKDKVRTNLSTLEEQGIKQYTPTLGEDKWPRLVGTIQTVLGDVENWEPGTAKNMFVDYYFNNTVYKLQTTVPKGDYLCKAVFGSDWGEEYGVGGDNLALKVIDASGDVTFSMDYAGANKDLSHNYKPKDSLYDGVINKSGLNFNSRSTTYKKPFGAIKQGEQDVTFRFAADTMDAQLVKLELIDGNEISTTYNMSVTTVLDGKDYWEVTVPASDFDEIGVWGYKFIVIDGTTKMEYGDDGASGGTGATSDEGQTPYDLTVYASDYHTPDWMKDAVVYQIFPDRFFDGDKTNNGAKNVDGSRGDDVQLIDDWSAIPENPRQSEVANKPYYPDATTDGVWSNEFYGGDIAGIQEKLSYLQGLGVTAIYLNPVSWAASNHKYDATDYKHLDPMFGAPVYNTPGDPASGLDYPATKEASDKVYSDFAEACDNLGIQLISDGVFNHVGDDSIYFDRYEKYPEIGAYEYWSRVWDTVEKDNISQVEAEAKVKSYYMNLSNPATGSNYTLDDFSFIDWFKVGPEKIVGEDGVERYEYDAWWGYDSLPVITTVEEENTNLSNDSLATIAGAHEYNNVDYREHVIGYDLQKISSEERSEAMQYANSQRWLWMGASGWRLDVAPDVSNDTWRQFRTAVKSAEGETDGNGNLIKEPVILGEEWGVATDYLLGDMFDSVMNYQFRAALQKFIVNDGEASDFNTSLEIIRENYPEEAWQAMLNLVDSHDTVRNITKIDNPTWEEENIKVAPKASERAIKLQALTAIFQMSYPGAPTIYYGDEVGVTGTKDPDSRRTFPWERVTEGSDGSYTISSKYESEYGDLYDAYVKSAEVRNDHKDLFATGEIHTAYAEGDVIAYARKSNTEGGLSIINKSNEAAAIVADVADFLPDGLVLADQLGSGVSGTVTDGKLSINVPAYTGMMMVSTTELTALPSAPSNLEATAVEGSTGEVNLSWDAVSDATGYLVYRTLLEGTAATLLTEEPITATTYKDTTVANGTRYYYYVKTVVDGAKSVYSKVATALPSYKITTITTPSSVTDVTLGVGKKTEEITVSILIPGLTDQEKYAEKDVEGLIFTLGYYKMDGNKEFAEETKLRYSTDDEDGSKVYSASFEPTEVGTYKYFAKASVNNGFTYVESEVATMSAISVEAPALPVAPVLETPQEESNRVTLNWSVSSSENIAGFDIYRTEGTSEVAVKIATLEADAQSYIDYTVSNDTTYKYYVEAFSDDYGRKASADVTVTPKLTMVDVTVRLTIPTTVYTSATDNIYIAGDVNGWNAAGWLLKKPSGATDGNIVEYTFKMMAGKKIQYKYTRGTWDTEALTSNLQNDTTSPGNYGYSSTDTNINLTIKNQGGNKMLVEDYVLRWVDMPMMITVPRISYNGETIEYSTDEETFDLRASVPYGGIFTINDVNINTIKEGALNEFGIVSLDAIPLKPGLNTFVLNTQPTEETLGKEWFADSGRVGQMSGATEIKITRTSGVVDSEIPSEPIAIPPTTKTDNVTDENSNTTTTKTVTEASGESFTVEVKKDKTGEITNAGATLIGVPKIVQSKKSSKVKMDLLTTKDLEKALEAAAITAGSTIKNPLSISVKTPTNFLIEELKVANINAVKLDITIPDAIAGNGKVAIKDIVVEKEALQVAKKLKKKLSVTIRNDDGKENYTWTFRADDLNSSKKAVNDVNVALNLMDTSKNKIASNILEMGKKGLKGLAAQFENTEVLPGKAVIKVYVGNQKDIIKSGKVYLYAVNEKTKKLDVLNKTRYNVDKNGYVKIKISQCTDYVLLNKAASKAIRTELLDQVIVATPTKSLKKGEIFKVVTTIPVDVESKAVVAYKSSKSSIATVGKSGKITAKKKGTTTIKTTVKINGKKKTIITKITVK